MQANPEWPASAALDAVAAIRPRAWPKGANWSSSAVRLPPREKSVRNGLAAGGNRIRTIGPASGKVVDAKFQRSDPGRSNTDFAESSLEGSKQRQTAHEH